MSRRLKNTVRILLAAGMVLAIASSALASPLVTLPEFQAAYPVYVNHAQMFNFNGPCVDASGTIQITADITDIMSTATEPMVIAMLCQAPDYPAFTPLGPVGFSEAGMSLLTLSSVAGHPDAFAIEFVVPLGVTTFTMTIENSGWPEGCIDDMIDFAAWDRLSVSNGEMSIGALKAAY